MTFEMQHSAPGKGLDKIREDFSDLYQWAKDLNQRISMAEDAEFAQEFDQYETRLREIAMQTREVFNKFGEMFRSDQVPTDIANEIEQKQLNPVYERIGEAYAKLEERKLQIKQ